MIAGFSKMSHVDLPQLPAAALAAVLDFMRYDDVRSSLLAGKTIADDAAKHVQTLNITKATQMDAPAARSRFQNVEQVNIGCLLARGRRTLSPDAASRIVLFLTIFPKLKKVSIGGPRLHSLYGGWIRTYYENMYCEEPANHKALFCGLVDAFCGAFKMRSLPNSLESLDGIVDNQYRFPEDSCPFNDDPNQPCVRCREICTHFPLNIVIDYNINICVSLIDRCKIAQGRLGGVEYLENASTEILIKFLRFNTHCDSVYDEKAFYLKMEEIHVMPDSDGDITVYYMSSDQLALLDNFIEFGFNPKDVAKDKLTPQSGCFNSWNESCVLTKSTFDALVARGFDLDTKFPIVDERIEPALQKQTG